MVETSDQSGNKEIWKKDENETRPRRKLYSKRKESKIKKLARKLKKWYNTTFRANAVPNPYKYFSKQRGIASAKRRKQFFQRLKSSIFSSNKSVVEINSDVRQKRKSSRKSSKLKKELKKIALKPITDLTKKKKINIYTKFQREVLLNTIKEPIAGLFSNKKSGGSSKTKRSFKYYFEKEQRKLRQEKYKKIKNNIITAPVRLIKSTARSLKKFFKFILNFRKQFALLRNDLNRISINSELKDRLIYTYLNSTLSFLLSFILIFFINQIVTVYLLSLYNIPTILHSMGGFINYSDRYRQIMDYLDIIYLVGPFSYLWTRLNIIVIFGTAPFLSLLLAVFFYRLYGIAKTKLRFLKVFFLWSLINSFNMFFGAYIAGAITRTGFIKFSEWIFFSNKYDIGEIIMMTCSMIVLITIGYFTRTFFLKAADHKDLTIQRNRIYYLFAQVLLPYISGILVLLLISVPYIVHFNIFIYLTIAFVVVTSVVSPRGFQKENITVIKQKRDYNILKLGTFLLLLILLVFKIFFYKGITII